VTNKGILVILVGPTAVGKTDLSIALAKKLGCPIISADSRQVYREMRIGTAVPSQEQLNSVQHYFIQNKSIHDRFTAGMFEIEVIALLDKLFEKHPVVLMVGGAGLYIDAVQKGIDDIPIPSEKVRHDLMKKLETEGIESLATLLNELDPDFYNQVDLKNPKRLLRALEVCLTAGKPYSQLRNNFDNKRPFKTVLLGLNLEREILYNRINRRVDLMVAEGLVNEAKALYPQRSCNALNTVGYKELFDHFDGKISLDEAIDLVKRNSRRYAKRQLTWFGKYDMPWFSPLQEEAITEHLLTLTQIQ
jgi:tRNA dimethylallyltransferase